MGTMKVGDDRPVDGGWWMVKVRVAVCSFREKRDVLLQESLER